MRRVGEQASAMSMTIRCCMPPLNWCGYLLTTSSGCAIPNISRSNPEQGVLHVLQEEQRASEGWGGIDRQNSIYTISE